MINNADKVIHQTEEGLVAAINKSKTSDQPAYTVLKTDEKVIARVTDGIYRQPSSALRELISNAYDADATRVVIKTDAPRFQRISIEDNGHGMSPEALARMLMHIGGSAKRQNEGKDFGITSKEDPDLSPRGRRLIGKIGIGIFSVAQLTHNFQIITKTCGDDFKTVAIVNLRQYSDDGLDKDGKPTEYESGKVTIWREKATDINASGTTIVLNNIRPQARETLQSKEIWSAIEHSEENSELGEQKIVPPKYHVGKINSKEEELLKETDGKTVSVPWDIQDTPKAAFAKLVDAVWGEMDHSNPNPQLEKIFDYYLQMVWNLGLSIPVPYVQEHLFDISLDGWADSYLVANEPKGAAKVISSDTDESLREILNLVEGSVTEKFDVFLDDLQLLRPIKFKGLPSSGHALKKPIILVGNCTETFAKYPQELSGGPLSFEAYLFWTPKVAPTEHRGSLIRINGASGTLFDPSFMRYQVSEQTRLKQITCEIFIREGFDSALNIDRESFNFAHPHSVYLTRWLHSALRQLATTQKRIASEVRTEAREENKSIQREQIQEVANRVWKYETDDEFSSPPEVAIIDSPAISKKTTADIAIRRFLEQDEKPKKLSPILAEKTKAITQVLSAFGLLEHLNQQQQQRLLNALLDILEIAE